MKEFQLQPFIIKNNSISLFLNWRVTRYMCFFMLISLPAGLLSTINYSNSDIIFFTVRLIQLSIFIFLGILHSGFLENRPLFTHHSIKEKFYLSFVLSLVIYGALLLFYSLINSDMQHMAITSSCAFLLPYIMVQAWNYFLLQQENDSMIWNGYKKVNTNQDIAYLNTLMIQIRLSKKQQVSEQSSFIINTPLNLELGELFNSFLNIENKENSTEIEYMDEDNLPFGWKFYAVTFGGLYQRVLDPEKSLQNNGNIKKNTTILAKRVRLA